MEKFIVTPKEDKSVTMTIRIDSLAPCRMYHTHLWLPLW